MSKPRILEIAADEMWSPYYEEINELLHQEKKARQENDSNKSAEVCVKVLLRAFEEKSYQNVTEWLLLLIKRRG
jgi:hypothetical protein